MATKKDFIVEQGIQALNGDLTLASGKSIKAGSNVFVTFTGSTLTIAGSRTLDFGGNKLTNIGAPTSNTDATTKQYVDTAISGVGGSASAVQSELDALELALGSAISSSGTFAGFSGTHYIDSSTSLSDAMSLLDTAIFSKASSIATLTDVTLTSLANHDLLRYDNSSSKWVNVAIGSASGVQAYDAGLTNLAAKSSTGVLAQTGADTFGAVTFVAPSTGFTITDDSAGSGDVTFALANDLAALEGLTGTGFAVRTGADSWAQRSITGSTGRIVVTNGDGVASSPTIDLDTVSDSGSGTFLKFTRDTYGRVTGTTAVTTSDITSLVDSTYVNVAGDTMTGNLSMGGHSITNVAAPVNSTDAANKGYVDAMASSLNVHGAVEVATVAALTAAYDNGTAGVGATLTATTNVVLPAIDGYTGLIVGSRVLVKNQADAKQNGIYVVTDLGSAGSAPWVLTRATDSDNHIAGQVMAGDFVFVAEGSSLAATGWVMSAVGTGTNDAIVLGTDNVTFTQFSGAGTYTAGTGLDLTGTTFSVKLGAGIVDVPTGEVGIDLYSSTDALRLTTDGSTASTNTAAKLTLVLKSAGGLTQDSNGLYIPAAGVSNAMLANSSFTLDGDSGTSAVALGGTLNIVGDSVQGTVTAVSGGTVTVSALDASTSQKGVAKFDTTSFAVSSGNVTIKAGGVSNSMLVNSSMQFGADSGSNSTVALGNTLNLIGDGIVTTTSNGSHTVTFSVADATTTTKGVASFSSSNFDVTSGAVTIKAGGVTGTEIAAGAVDLTTKVTGVLPKANGGAAGVAAGQVAFGDTGGGTITSSSGLTFTSATNTLTTSHVVANTDAAIGGTFITSNSGSISGGSASDLIGGLNLSASSFDMITFKVKVSDGTDKHVCTIDVMYNGSTVYMTQYGDLMSNDVAQGTFDVDVSSGHFRLMFTPAVSGSHSFAVGVQAQYV